MKPKRNSKLTFFLLSLYAIVLIHGFIAHLYDNELGYIFQESGEYNLPTHSTPQAGFSKKEVHFNILSEEFQTNTQKIKSISEDFILTKQSFISLFRMIYTTKPVPYQAKAPCKHQVRFSLLRSPPLG